MGSHSPGGAAITAGDFVSSEPISHGDAAPLHVAALGARGAGRAGGLAPARAQAVAGLQVAQREGAVDWAVDDGAALLRHSLAAAHMVPHQGRHVVKALLLEQVLDVGVALARFHHHLVDLEVQGLVAPAAREHIVAQAGERVPDKEVAIALHQGLRNLKEAGSGWGGAGEGQSQRLEHTVNRDSCSLGDAPRFRGRISARSHGSRHKGSDMEGHGTLERESPRSETQVSDLLLLRDLVGHSEFPIPLPPNSQGSGTSLG